MAKAKAKKSNGDSDDQEFLEGMAPKKIPDLHAKGQQVRRLSDERAEILTKQTSAEGKLLELMKKHGPDLPTVHTKKGTQAKVYAFGTVRIEWEMNDKLSVRVNEKPTSESNGDEEEVEPEEAETVTVSDN